MPYLLNNSNVNATKADDSRHRRGCGTELVGISRNRIFQTKFRKICGNGNLIFFFERNTKINEINQLIGFFFIHGLNRVN